MNIVYIIFKNRLYYEIDLELSFFERTINERCFHV